MKLSEFQYDLIQKYLRDELSDTDQAAFSENMRSQEFKNELLNQAEILNALERGYDQDLKKVLNNLEVSPKEVTLSPPQIKTAKRKTTGLWLKYAACFLFGLASYFVVNNYLDNPQNDLYAEYYQIYPAEIIRGATTESMALNQALITYQEQDYVKAEELFKPLRNSSDQALFFSSISQIQLGKFDAAAATLKEVINSGSKFNKDAEWYLLMVYLKSEQHTKMDLALSKIINQSDHPYHSKAIQLQKDLEG